MKRKFQASFNGFHVDSHSGVRHDYAGELRLQAKELAVLVELIVNAGQLVTKEDLIQSVWGGSPVSDSSIARCISAIKSQLKGVEPGSDTLIKMVYGQGYRFVGDVTSSACFLCEESFTVLINTSPDFILFKDGDGRWLEANQSALQSFDLKDKNWRGKTDSELASMLPAPYLPTLEGCIRTDADAWKEKIPSRTLEIIALPDGSKRYYDIVKSPLFNKDGTRNFMIVFGRDVTDLSRLLEHQKLSAQVLENSHEAVMITDVHNNIVSVNRAFTIVTEYTEAEVLGKNPRILSSGRHDSDFYSAMWHELGVEGVWRGEIWDKKKSGKIYLKWLNISSVHDIKGELSNYIAIFSDLTERRAIDEKIEFLAYHDPLTGLPNRLLLHDRFKQAVASATRENTMIAVLFLDLDKFKQVNDALGHAIGDELLQLVAKRIEQSVREVDTVSRIGGDEFAVLLTDLRDAQTVSLIAEKILKELAAPFTLSATTVHSSLSIGISFYPNDGLELDLLLRMSDASMYHAKNCGRNNYRFFSDQSSNHEHLRKLRFESDPI
jgi:diguanylate cyclase (GGDEF)-like protein/PAS domain S-box-containing protein